jgi:hypothetical protein
MKMENITNPLVEILANQVALYKRMENLEKAIKGGARLAQDSTYVEELKKEADKYKNYVLQTQS